MSWNGPLAPVAGSDVIHEIPKDYTGKDGTLRMRVPGRIIADADLLAHIRDDLAPEQVANVATLPGIVGHSLAMPDIHWGYGFPIGGVAAFDPDDGGVVSPGGVGFDINCGVRLLRTDLQVDDVRKRLPQTLDRLFSDIPAGMGSRGSTGVADRQLSDVMAEGARWAVAEGILDARDAAHLEEGGRIEGADPSKVSQRARVRGRRTLGSLGSGNHFLEVQVVDRMWDEAACKAYGVAVGQVVVMIHTGSRGLGHQVCQDFLGTMQEATRRYGIGLPDRQLACAPLASREAQDYLGAMAAACNFAFVNRSVLAAAARDSLEALYPGVVVETLYDVCHNIAKWEEHHVPEEAAIDIAGGGAGSGAAGGGDAGGLPRSGSRRRLCVHRKGATRAFGPGHAGVPVAYRDVGQPVLVPGDMGRMSFLLAASQGAMTTSFGSSCHGAGRQMSRTQAKKTWRGQDLVRDLAAQGIEVRAVTASVAAEEAPLAYKDVSQVVESVERAGLARKAARLLPLGVVKG